MSSMRRRQVVMQALAMKMLEEGKILSKHEYENCKNLPIRSAEILRQFGSWTRILNLIEHNMPEIWKEIQTKHKKVIVDPLKELSLQASFNKTAMAE